MLNIKDIEKANSEGRLFATPCKVGDRFYFVRKSGQRKFDIIFVEVCNLFPFGEPIGNRVYNMKLTSANRDIKYDLYLGFKEIGVNLFNTIEEAEIRARALEAQLPPVKKRRIYELTDIDVNIFPYNSSETLEDLTEGKYISIRSDDKNLYTRKEIKATKKGELYIDWRSKRVGIKELIDIMKSKGFIKEEII